MSLAVKAMGERSFQRQNWAGIREAIGEHFIFSCVKIVDSISKGALSCTTLSGHSGGGGEMYVLLNA